MRRRTIIAQLSLLPLSIQFSHFLYASNNHAVPDAVPDKVSLYILISQSLTQMDDLDTDLASVYLFDIEHQFGISETEALLYSFNEVFKNQSDVSTAIKEWIATQYSDQAHINADILKGILQRWYTGYVNAEQVGIELAAQSYTHGKMWSVIGTTPAGIPITDWSLPVKS